MNASQVLATFEADGLELSLRDGRLCVRPAGRISPPLAELVRQHSHELRVLLAEQDDRGECRRSEERPASGRSPTRATWPFAEWSDLRPCLLCRNLTQMRRCLSAWRGELRAARDYSPTFPGQPQRCIGYRPKGDDPDQRPGRERWPELVAWQARIGGGDG